MKKMYLVADARDEIIFLEKIDRKVSDYDRVIWTLTLVYHDHVGRTKLFWIVEVFSFDGSLDLISIEQTGKIYWTRVNAEEQCLN